MEENYKFVSETLDSVYLHDCLCSELYYDRNSNILILEMDYMEILKGHPLNNKLMSYTSDKGKIIFYEPQLINCEIENRKSINKYKKNNITFLEKINFTNMEFLDYEQETTDTCFKGSMDIVINNKIYNGYIELEILFTKVSVMWNKLQEVSWVNEFY